MASIAEALTDLGITEWVLRGEPTNETEITDTYTSLDDVVWPTKPE